MTPNPYANQALLALQRGDSASAERWAHEAYRAAPHEPRALLAYGVVMNARGSYDSAAKAFRRLTQIEPGEPVHWMNLASAERAAGNLAAAGDGYERAAALGGWTVDLLWNSALLELQRGNIPLARARLAKAMTLRPVDAEIACHYAQLLMQSGEPAAVRAAVQGWQQWRNWTAERLSGFGLLQMAIGEYATAQGILARLKREPENSPAVEIDLITLLERTNQLDEATARLRALELRPGLHLPAELLPRWLGLRAQMASRNGDNATAITLYREMLKGEVPLLARQEILFPLAKALDADHQYAAAMEAAIEAHVSQMAYFDLAAPADDEEEGGMLAMTEHLCVAADVARWTDTAPPHMEDSPVFVVAFPRSGTTLLEQMLDAHPGLQTMDEQRFLLDAQERLQEQGLRYPDGLGAAEPHQLAEARRHYWERVSSKVKLVPGQRLLDKNPLNMLRLPVIRRLWPDAPILLAVRHPFDVIISNYFQHFRAPDYARLCRDLPALADGYARIFDYWYAQARLLRPKVMEVFYEQFVSDFEAQARAIAAFCGLDWHEAMLEPSAHALRRGYIGTPSYDQVIKPVNRNAVDRWRRYEAEMLPLRGRVEHLLRRWQYSAEAAM